ncbi:hypothetical protein Pcinc_014624 [Petrolisthes cinctipes]|uniref:Uncharacterized protein n=1 Tax=Petrolisthes cinctipes TaxID=88211 RepID=A0AAE1KT22_PETCI|nr:hypothetical protein Pcinc_014624 [Petrolisthes cinctipes]
MPVTQAMYTGDRYTSELASNLLDELQEQISTASDSVEGRMYGGCTDSFSVFGFLAFLLALLDLILELQAMNTTRRRREAHHNTLYYDPDEYNQQDNTTTHPEDTIMPSAPLCQDDGEMREAASASYSLLRGYLNALATEQSGCAARFMCEAAEEAAAAGSLGRVVAKVASMNAESWLMKVNSTLYSEVGDGDGQCALRYSQCFSLPASYHHPHVYTGSPHQPLPPPHVYQPLLNEVMDVVREALI